MAGKRAEAYALYCRARNLAEDALKKLQNLDGDNKVSLIIFKDQISRTSLINASTILCIVIFFQMITLVKCGH